MTVTSAFEAIDPVLIPWADRHQFKVDVEYKGYRVRSIAIPDIRNPGHLGQSAQLWVEPTAHDPTNPLTVNVAVGRWSSKERVRLPELERALDNQLAMLKARGDL
ncbi:MAG TPA: hypothetical protein VGM17_03525 [Rhizomicrobium sp.]|jgi:hypothetical protein